MIVDRRMTLAGIMGAGVVGAVPVRAAVARATGTVLIVDSRRPPAAELVARHPMARVIDIADAEADLWKDVRAFAPGRAQVRGLTRWSDWVLLRGMLLEKGLRVRAETAIDPAATGDGALFLWDMA